MQTQDFHYAHNEQTLYGRVAHPAGHGPHPVAMVVHAFWGRDDFVEEKICALARLGYIGFAVDLYGEGKLNTTIESGKASMAPFMEDRSLGVKRLNAALEAIQIIKGADSNRITAVGYSFGGMCVLDLARTGIKLTGVVSFHGLLMSPSTKLGPEIQTPVLSITGYDDHMIPPSQVKEFQDEMDASNADWQTIVLSGTRHAFTMPSSGHGSAEPGCVYNPTAAQRAWTYLLSFLAR